MNDRLNYRTHMGLLEQVAASEEEAREVRRILGPDLQREMAHLRDFDRSPNPEPWPSCCGACGQGRRKCPIPQACEMPEAGSEEIPGLLLAVLMVCAVVVVVFFSPGGM